MIHDGLDKWLYDIEQSGDLSPKNKRLAMTLGRLHEKYWKLYDKHNGARERFGGWITHKYCADRTRPPMPPVIKPKSVKLLIEEFVRKEVLNIIGGEWSKENYEVHIEEVNIFLKNMLDEIELYKEYE